jgi:NADH-quinone oxidoreductase subunit M
MSGEVLSSFLVGLLFVPLAGAVVVALLGSRNAPAVRWVSLGATLINLLFAVLLAVNLNDARTGKQAPQRSFSPPIEATWILLPLNPDSTSQSGHSLGAIQFHLGLDGLNVWLVALTALLMVSAVLGSWTSVQERVNEYYAWMLLLEMAMLGVFVAMDIVLFYTFFELTLVPLFLLIGIWGGPQRQHAARKFFIYTLTGSLITLLGVLGVVMAVYSRDGELTFQIPRLVEIVQQRLALPGEREYWQNVQIWVFLGLMAGFAIKVPLVPVHTWLPLAHVEAPTAGSVLLAGVLLKVGTYGFLRLCLPLAPDASLSLGVPLIGALAVIGIIYGSFCALAQDDIKKMVAYSSVSHLGYCMLGMFALNLTGLSGSLLQMINHGLSTGALFLLVGMLYERYHTRQMNEYGGMGSRLHLLGLFMVFITLTSIGIPGLNGFAGEMLVLFGIYNLDSSRADGHAFATLGAIGLLLGAWYMLTMLKRVFFGAFKEPHFDEEHRVRDLNYRELAALVPIAVLCVVIGVKPMLFLDVANPDLKVVAGIADDARARAAASTAEQIDSPPAVAAGMTAEGKP